MYQEFLHDVFSLSNDIRTSLEITPQEAMQGTTRVIPLSSNMPCPLCGGGGMAPGLFLPKSCNECQGQGIVPCQKHFQVFVPAGISDGEMLTIRGKGLYTLFAQQRGDLYIQINVRSNAPIPIQHRHPAVPAPQPAVQPSFAHNAPTVADTLHRPAPQPPIVQPSFSSHAPKVAGTSYQPASPPMTPAQLGNYRIIRQLGSGGMGNVYLGQHLRLNTYAAIKTLQHMTPQDEQDFLREAQMLASLRHSHILRVLDFGTEGNIPFLIMDYAQGGTLRERHPNGSQLPLRLVISYITQMAEALQYAHDQRIIHRDVKPENMLVDQPGTILLSDFGIAIAAHSTRSMRLEEPYGTLFYVAPEQLDGFPRPASDQYSLAIVAYEWICGRYPFEGSKLEVLRHHRYTPPPSLRTWVPATSPRVEQVVLRALAKDPQQRFASVQAFAAALEQAL